MGAQDTHALIPMQQQCQKELLSICDENKVEEIGCYAGNRETSLSNDVSRGDKAVPDRSSLEEDTQIDFIMNMLCNNEVGSGEQNTETNLCEIRGQLQTQEAELNPQTEAVDVRALSACDLHKKVNESDNLSHEQKESLFHKLSKYRAQFTSKPGLCKSSEYEFEVQCSEPIVGHSRPIPFSVRPAVREQIRQMMADNVLEISTSSHVNPLTIVLREGRAPRICVDARKVNRYTLPDRARAPPIQELLQQFHGSKFITSIDLSSAFLQIGQKKESRKYTSLLFDSQLYQFTRCPYGFRNSLPAFVKALQLTLGSDTHDYALAYVDDIVVHSPIFELHLKHLDTVLSRLTRAGFTVNAVKCNFCKVEISFLGHIIRQGVVSHDPRRIEAILNYPAPRNQRQLCQLLGTTNYHHRIVRYADCPRYSKREARGIGLHRHRKHLYSSGINLLRASTLYNQTRHLSYTIYTEASGRAIGGD